MSHRKKNNYICYTEVVEYNHSCLRVFRMSSLISLSFSVLTEHLGKDPDCIYNLEFKRRIVSNDVDSVEYYLGDYSKDIVSYIEANIVHHSILTEYYFFLSDPLDSNREPTWHRVSLYDGRRGSSLYTYTSNISFRHFCRQAAKERKQANKHVELLDFLDYESLIQCDFANYDDENHEEMKNRARMAYSRLSERDKQAINVLVIKKMHWSKAFDALCPYLNPKTYGEFDTREKVLASWSNKQKQDAMSLLKGRAIERLQRLYKSIK